MKKNNMKIVLTIIVIAAVIVGALSFGMKKEEVTITDKVDKLNTTSKTTMPSTTKVTIPSYQEELITIDECENIYETLMKDPTRYSLDNLTNCGYENVYDKFNYVKKFSSTYTFEDLSTKLNDNLSEYLETTVTNNTTNIKFKVETGNENYKNEKIAGVVKTFYDFNTSSKELNVFYFTSNGIYRLYFDNIYSINKYTFKKITDKTNYKKIVVHRLGNDRLENVFFYVDNNDKYINIETLTIEKNQKNIFYEDNSIKINKDRTIYINGSVKPSKVHLYVTNTNNKIIYVIDSDGYLYGYSYIEKEDKEQFQRLYTTRITEILYNKNKLALNRYNQTITTENDKPNYIIIFNDNSIRVLDYQETIPVLNN